MKRFLYILLLFPLFLHAQIADETNVNWQYGRGNGELVMVLNGAWKPVQELNLQKDYSDFKIQLYKTVNSGTIIPKKDSGLWADIRVYEFGKLQECECIKSQTLDTITVTSFYVGNGTNTANYSYSLVYGYTKTIEANIIPGTFSITAGSKVVYDDGNGHLTGNVGAASTIDYGYTGIANYNVTFDAAIATTTQMLVSYQLSIQTISKISGFVRIQDIPTGYYSVAVKDLYSYDFGDESSTVYAKPTFEIKQSINHTYTNQTAQLK